MRERVREALKRTPDIERALPRLSVGRGGPRDLAALRDGLDSAEALAGIAGRRARGVDAAACAARRDRGGAAPTIAR